jgi:hypothetical protein
MTCAPAMRLTMMGWRHDGPETGTRTEICPGRGRQAGDQGHSVPARSAQITTAATNTAERTTTGRLTNEPRPVRNMRTGANRLEYRL